MTEKPYTPAEMLELAGKARGRCHAFHVHGGLPGKCFEQETHTALRSAAEQIEQLRTCDGFLGVETKDYSIDWRRCPNPAHGGGSK